MTNEHPAVKQIEDAYKKMAGEGRYRPGAPSDGFGNLAVPEAELDLDAEAHDYAAEWIGEEDTHDFHVGVPSYDGRAALIYTIEAARNICGMSYPTSIGLLKLAIADLEKAHEARKKS